MIIAKFVLWEKKWVPFIKGATTSLNYIVTPIWWPWKTKLPLHPMLTSFLANSSNPNPQNSSKPLIISPKIVFNVVEALIDSTHRRIGIFFQPCTIYKWIDNHCVLSMVVTSFTLTSMKLAQDKRLTSSRKFTFILNMHWIFVKVMWTNIHT